MNHLALFCLAFVANLPMSAAPVDFVPASLPPDLAKYYLVEGSVGESGGVSEWDGRGREFGIYVTNHWLELLAGWKGSSPTLNQVYLVISEAESLSPAEYVRFLSRLVDLCEAGRIDSDKLGFAIHGEGKKEGFVAFNYQNPDLQAMMVRCERLAAAKHDKQQGDYFADIRSGKMKSESLNWADSQAGRKMETLPDPLGWALMAIALTALTSQILLAIRERRRSRARINFMALLETST
jgi:hypothetical protein